MLNFGVVYINIYISKQPTYFGGFASRFHHDMNNSPFFALHSNSPTLWWMRPAQAVQIHEKRVEHPGRVQEDVTYPPIHHHSYTPENNMTMNK